jgi:ubiquinone/menaquinone biosynthesis C-methylase UbiE
MTIRARRPFVTTLVMLIRVIGVLALIVTTATPQARAQTASENEADVAWLMTALEIHPGSSVGEIGAGGGELTFLLAREVGGNGRIYTNDLNKERLQALRREAAHRTLSNVTAIEGRETETNLPERCCDAIFMRNVYHHFGDPQAMNASLLKSLKPGGRLAIIDFTPPPGGETAPGHRGDDNHHGITAPTLEKELKAAGFEIVSSDSTNRTVRVVARRIEDPIRD